MLVIQAISVADYKDGDNGQYLSRNPNDDRLAALQHYNDLLDRERFNEDFKAVFSEGVNDSDFDYREFINREIDQ